MHITHRLFAATLIAMSGASVMVAMTGPRHIELGLVLAATCGAFIAGIIAAPLFGQPHRQGAIMACLGAVFTTVSGAAIAGIGYGIIAAEPGAFLIAPLVVGAMILSSAHILMVWITTMAGAHLVMWFLRSTPDWTD
jgi:hypothetical protein